MAAPKPMNVLLQGDVGSGKTLVAVHASLVAIGSGHQAAIMAPHRGARRAARAVGRGVAPWARWRRPPGPGAGRPPRRRRAGSRCWPSSNWSRRARRRTRDVRDADVRGDRQGPDQVLAGIADGTVDRDRNPRVGAGGGRVPGLVPRGRRRAAPIRTAPAHGPEGQGRRRDRRPDHNRDADPPDARAHVLRGPRRRRPRRDAQGRQPIGTAAARSDEGAPPPTTSSAARSRRDDRPSSSAPRSTRGNRTQVRAAETEAQRLATEVFPDLHVEAPARADATEGEGTRDGRLPRRSRGRPDLHDGGRGGRRRAEERHRDARRERRAVRARAGSIGSVAGSGAAPT